jgi:hypothetical protein
MGASPGPGAYDPSDSLIKSSAKTVKIAGNGDESRAGGMTLTFTPGPGAYDMRDLMGRNSPAI